MMKFLSFEDIV